MLKQMSNRKIAMDLNISVESKLKGWREGGTDTHSSRDQDPLMWTGAEADFILFKNQ